MFGKKRDGHEPATGLSKIAGFPKNWHEMDVSTLRQELIKTHGPGSPWPIVDAEGNAVGSVTPPASVICPFCRVSAHRWTQDDMHWKQHTLAWACSNGHHFDTYPNGTYAGRTADFVQFQHDFLGDEKIINRPDYVPVTLQEIVELHQEAREDRAKRTPPVKRASIQLRLCRGIIGSTRPQKERSKAQSAEKKISRLYVSFLEGTVQLSMEQLALLLFRIMQSAKE